MSPRRDGAPESSAGRLVLFLGAGAFGLLAGILGIVSAGAVIMSAHGSRDDVVLLTAGALGGLGAIVLASAATASALHAAGIGSRTRDLTASVGSGLMALGVASLAAFSASVELLQKSGRWTRPVRVHVAMVLLFGLAAVVAFLVADLRRTRR